MENGAPVKHITSRTVTKVVGDPAPPRGSRVQSVDRGMHLLRAVADAHGTDASAVRLAESCGLNRATAWRILSTLEEHGMVACDRDTGRWTIGMAVVEIARAAGVDAVVASAHAVLERLSRRTGETAALAVLRSGGLTYVDEVTPPTIVAATWAGQTVPLHATSTGKVVLAFGDPAVVDRATGTLERFTATTITSREVLHEELARTRGQGYAICRGEYDESAWGVSAPVLDAEGRTLAVLSIWGPGNRVGDAQLHPLGALVLEAAAEIVPA